MCSKMLDANIQAFEPWVSSEKRDKIERSKYLNVRIHDLKKYKYWGTNSHEIIYIYTIAYISLCKWNNFREMGRTQNWTRFSFIFPWILGHFWWYFKVESAEDSADFWNVIKTAKNWFFCYQRHRLLSSLLISEQIKLQQQTWVW